MGHRFRLVRLAAVADRGDAAARDSRRDASQAQLRRAGAGRRSRQDGDLQWHAARLYRIHPRAALGEITGDKVAAIKAEYVAAGGLRSNRRYGFVHRATA